MSLFFDYTLDGIANGMIYAALALALVLIYRATRIINFAQGAAGMMTTFIAFSLLSRGLGYWWAFVAGAGHRLRHRRGDRARPDPPPARQVAS